MSHIANDKNADLLLDYLAEIGKEIGDIHSDEEGYFYFDTVENGNPEEDGYEAKSKKVYIPERFNLLFI